MSSTKLLHGPYQSPPVSIGDWVTCEIRGLVQVKTFTDAPIPQPIKRGQGAAIIVCEDLARALRVESASAVSHWWGVSTHRVSIWRRELGIETANEGTIALWQAHPGNPDIAARARDGAAASLAPESRKRRDAAHSDALKARLKQLGRSERRRLRNIGVRGGNAMWWKHHGEKFIARIEEFLLARKRVHNSAVPRIMEWLRQIFRDRWQLQRVALRNGVTTAAISQRLDWLEENLPDDLREQFLSRRALLDQASAVGSGRVGWSRLYDDHEGLYSDPPQKKRGRKSKDSSE